MVIVEASGEQPPALHRSLTAPEHLNPHASAMAK
jgi:hypothetical protein